MSDLGRILSSVTPTNVLRWTGVAFVVALEAIIIVAIVLAMTGVWR